MSKQIAISVRSDHTLIGLFEKGELVDLFIDRPEQESAVGNIYVGKVTKILGNLQSAFVDIGLSKDGFLPGDEAWQGERPRGKGRQRPLKDRIKEGKLITVQVQKDEIADKGKKLTMDISLPGRFLVYMPFHKKINVSKRVRDRDERNRLTEVIQSARGSDEGGWIVRTGAEGMPKKEIQRDVRDLIQNWKRISTAINAAKQPSLIHLELSPIEQVLRDYYTKDHEKILVDNLRVKQHVDRFIRSISPARLLHFKVTEYVEPEELMERYNFRKELQRALARKVWLKCGGYLIVEEGETLTAIDVNTGKNVSGKDQAETIRNTNLESAEEIARQLRLRGIGGIIVVDFIDMRNQRDNQKVIQILKKAMMKDRAAFDITTFSEIGLVQITRKRTGESLIQMLSEECPHCAGNGRILTHRTP